MQPVRQPFVGQKAVAYRIIRSHGLHDRLDHLEGKTHPVFKAAAIGVGSLVGSGRKKLNQQIAGPAMNFQPVEAGLLDPPGCGGIGLNDPLDILQVHFLGNNPIGFHRGRGDLFFHIGIPAGMVDLEKGQGALLVDGLGQTGQAKEKPLLINPHGKG